MMHAIIVETPLPGPRRIQPAEAPSQCAKQLSSADQDYFRRRAAQETEAAQMSGCCEARIAHEELALAYRRLCTSNKFKTNSELASLSPVFRFNPRPAT